MCKLIIFILFLAACASPELAQQPANLACPTEAQEPVSKCRAENACKYETAARTGLGRSLGTYNSCFNQDMQRQKENALKKEKGG